ncbi:MAG: hypothetical protein KatS3mg060_1764 [Dehalococcoidia bacterium]|nr:MAG: hypothetical protein KatS3mg060_1764 [Dehalococcoidia bacterium]
MADLAHHRRSSRDARPGFTAPAADVTRPLLDGGMGTAGRTAGVVFAEAANEAVVGERELPIFRQLPTGWAFEVASSPPWSIVKRNRGR